MKTIHVEFSDERLITPSGLIFVGQILEKSDFIKKINSPPYQRTTWRNRLKMGTFFFPMLGCYARDSHQYVPVDIDVTTFDNSKSNKEGVSRTYKGFDGYAPIMAYIGTEGYLVNLELRGRKQHGWKETPDFLVETIALCHQLTDKPLLIRLDSGNDASENIGIFMEESYKYNNVSFIIKRNLRKESRQDWLDSVKDCCINVRNPRDRKTVYIGQTFRDVTYTLSDKTEKTVGICTIYEITERTIDKYGQVFLIPDIELNTLWTNLPLPDETMINLYHAHGECEQYHSEIKTDMDIERLLSGKFGTNRLFFELTIIAYNILPIIGQESLKKQDNPSQKKSAAAEYARLSVILCSLRDI